MARKQCVACGEFKNETEFPWWSETEGRSRGTCRACKSQQQKKWYSKKRETHIANVKSNIEQARTEAHQFVRNYLSTHPCIDCGEANPIVLEFDHVRGQKRLTISQLCARGYTIEVIAVEIDKCVVRCGNCHRRKTSAEKGWFRL